MKVKLQSYSGVVKIVNYTAAYFYTIFIPLFAC
jgi:hypothetical protein